jgi:valyl-tRNA synthetase
MTKKELSKTFDPSICEEKWYLFWEERGYFKPSETATKSPYTIILPPPNVTGALHMGHALVNTIQDILIRFKRMQGHKTLWIPGTDHAGISTQAVVERHLYATLGKRKRDFSRDEFLKQVWLWKDEYADKILNQLKKLGSSLDWSRLRFTMDDVSTKAVKTMFKKMYDEGLIYRGDYLVNWDPLLQTAIADDEVEHEEKNSSLWYFNYPIAEDPKHFITIATTRPETMLGDTAVAVSPKDERYKHLIGKHVLLPIANRKIPIIEDAYVDPSFGSGVVKITPAHDFNDYEVGKRHLLPMINILNPNGTLNENGLAYEGLNVEEAREKVVLEMKRLGLIEKIEPHTLRVGISYRSKGIIQPYLSKQWFIKMEPFKQKLLDAVRSESVKIVPKDFEKTYFHWIENLRDWCISRQLWWGHQIPIWYHKDNPSVMICHIEEGLPKEVLENPESYVQDEDVLDTWFSSALWPITTLGWPENTSDLNTFYPTATLVTGHDILFFWVARMILMGEYATGKVPFHETFIHGLIYGKSYWRKDPSGNILYVTPSERKELEASQNLPADIHSKWEKMSKSKGNVIDPIEIISEYGADAMRFALAASVTHARQIDLDRRRFEEYKNFANKLWNATRFILSAFDANEKGDGSLMGSDLSEPLDIDALTLDDKWILTRLNKTIYKVTKELNEYHFNEAAKSIYEFFWDEFCAYYLEISKPFLYGKVGSQRERKNKQKLLLITVMNSIRLMHPIVPFITEEIFSLLKERFEGIDPKAKLDPFLEETRNALLKEACIIAPFPETFECDDLSKNAEEEFNEIFEIVYALRNIRAELQIPLGSHIDVYLISEDKKRLEFIYNQHKIIQALVKVNQIQSSHQDEIIVAAGATAMVKGIKIFVPLPSDLKEKEKIRLLKELEKLIKQIESLQIKLENVDFVARAPKELVDKTKDALSMTKQSKDEIEKKLTLL